MKKNMKWLLTLFTALVLAGCSGTEEKVEESAEEVASEIVEKEVEEVESAKESEKESESEEESIEEESKEESEDKSEKKEAAGAAAAVTAVKRQLEKSDKEHYTFGFTAMTLNNPFFITIEETIREEVEANGDKLITTDPAMDVSLQISQIEDMITQGIDALFLNPVDWEGIRPALEKLEEAGIPVINYDAEVADMEFVTSYVGSDNYNAGYVVGEDLVKKLPEGGKIIILESPQMNSVRKRVEGFEDAIKDSDIEVVARQDAKGDLQTSMTITEDLLIANPDVDAIFGGNDPTALGALAAAYAQGFKDSDALMIYGVDGSPDLKSELVKGKDKTLIEGSGAQSPINMAKTAVKVAYKILRGEEFYDNYPVETFLISDDNISDYEPDTWQ